MKKQKKITALIGILIFVMLATGLFWGRAKVIQDIARQEHSKTKVLLESFRENALLKLSYELNYAKEMAQTIAVNPSQPALFDKAAEKVIKQEGVLYTGLIKDTTFVRNLPTDQFASMNGSDLREYPYAFMITKVTNEMVVEGPQDFLNIGKESFLFTAPLNTESGYWGATAVLIEKERVLAHMQLETLVKKGYEYELWHLNPQGGERTVVAATNTEFDFTDAERTAFELPGKWTLMIMPKAGWVSNKLMWVLNGSTFALLLVMAGLIWLWLRLSWHRQETAIWNLWDQKSGFYNRQGFQKEIEKWIQEGVDAFVVMYFVIDHYNSRAQISGEEEEHKFLEQIHKGVSESVLSESIIGRIGESNFAVAVKDNMTSHATQDLAKGISMEFIWKVRSGVHKAFLNVGFQYVQYPNDATEADMLIDKVIRDYFERITAESPIVSLTEKCQKLIEGQENIAFEEYADTYMMRLSGTINQYRKQVEQLAYMDTEYRVGNRSKYFRDAKMLISYDKKRRLDLYCMDICAFSNYNDLFSVETGDRILSEVCQRLGAFFGEHLYRINGDVFLGMIQGERKIPDVLEAVQQILSEPVRIGSLKLTIDFKYGICSYPQHGRTPEELLECVQTALHYAKRQEGMRVSIYDDELMRLLREEGSILSLLEERMSEGELEVWYQPIVDLHEHTYHNVEALLRLKDREGNYIPTSEVISVAEQNWMMDRIGSYVMDRVGSFAARNAERLGLTEISINLSAQELLSAELPDRILGQLKSYGVDPKLIILEITETFMIQSFDQILPTLLKLREAGIGIAMDDFGTGYSSLNYLARLPVTTLKIDRSMVREMFDTPKHLSVMKSIVELARCHEMLVVAEGVETIEEQKLVEQIGVDYIQGFYYSRPVPEEQLCELLEKKKTEDK